jgi:hypothetical protein
MIKLTVNETALLTSIAKHEMNATNGHPETATSKSELATYSWIEEFDAGQVTSLPGKKGVLSSLVKKGLLLTNGKGEESSIDFTDLGFETVMELIKPETLNFNETKEPIMTVDNIEDTLNEDNGDEELKSPMLTYVFPGISERFGSKEQLKIFEDLKITPYFNETKKTWEFGIFAEQKEDLIKAIRETKIFSRMKEEKLEKFFVKN